jgi:arylsulfatase A-like enzyme
MRPEHLQVSWLLGFLVLCCLPVIACNALDTTSKRPNIVLVTIESVRTDHVGAYGGRSRSRPEMPLTPNIDRLAEEAVVYEDAHAVTSWTLTSHASLFTGLYPTTHQTIRNLDRLGESYATIAEILSAAGYQTAAIVSGPYLRKPYNLDQGFQLYDDTVASVENAEAHGDVTNPEMAAALQRFVQEQRDPSRPFFLFAYFWDPHYDYIPPSPYDGMFVDDACDPINLVGYESNPTIHPRMNAGQLAYVFSQYAGELRWTDEQLGKFFRLLRQEGLWKNTVIILTADHGEEFFEHGAKGHKNNLYTETVRIPLLIKYRNGRQGRDPRPVSHVDILPTILELTDTSVSAPIHGRSLIKESFSEDRLLFFELLATRYLSDRTKVQRWTGVRKGDYKLVWNDRTIGAKETRTFGLFNVKRDPAEKEDLTSKQPEKLWELLETFEDWQVIAKQQAAQFRQGGTAELTESEIERLRSLGYVD